MTQAQSEYVTEASRQILQLMHQLHRWAQVRAMTGARSEVSFRQLAALTILADRPTTTTDIARRLQIRPPSITALIDRLERRGYVRRRAAVTGDRRLVLLELTAAGRDATHAAERHLVDEVAAQLASLTDEDVATLTRSLALLAHVVAALEAEVNGHQRPPRASHGLPW